MENIFAETLKYLEDGHSLALVTIIEKHGSAPRGPGARMVIGEDGFTKGTVGGGQAEYLAIKDGSEAIKEKKSFAREYVLSREKAAGLGMICGGSITLYFQYIGKDDGETKNLLERVRELGEGGESCRLILDVTQEKSWKMFLLEGEGLVPAMISGGGQEDLKFLKKNLGCLVKKKAGLVQADGKVYYTEALSQEGKVYVFGGGHVAQELVPLLSRLGFYCIVMDDRKEFSDAALFPGAKEVIRGDFEKISHTVSIKGTDYVCIMTRGHEHDYAVQKQVLALKPRYIGVMGSRNKIRTVTERLLEDGFSREEIQACHMPIGLDIGGQTPEEIAVSIAGELIAVRAGKE